MLACIDYDPSTDNDEPDNDNTGFGDTFVGGLLDDLWTATTNNLGTILGAFLGNNNNPNPESEKILLPLMEMEMMTKILHRLIGER